MKTFLVIGIFAASVAGLFQVLDAQHDDFVRIEPAATRPTPLPSSEPTPRVELPDQRSALQMVDPATLDRQAIFRAAVGGP